MNSVLFFRNTEANLEGEATSAPLLLNLQDRLRKLELNPRLAATILESQQRNIMDAVVILISLCAQPEPLLHDITSLEVNRPHRFRIEQAREDLLYCHQTGPHQSDLVTDLLAWSHLKIAAAAGELAQQCQRLGVNLDTFENAVALYNQLQDNLNQLNLIHQPRRKLHAVEDNDDITICFLKTIPELLVSWGTRRQLPLFDRYIDFGCDSLCYEPSNQLPALAVRWEHFLDTSRRVIVRRGALLSHELLREAVPSLVKTQENWNVGERSLPRCRSTWTLDDHTFDVTTSHSPGSEQYAEGVAHALIGGAGQRLSYNPRLCARLQEMRRRAGAHILPQLAPQALIDWLAKRLLKVRQHQYLQVHLDANHPTVEDLAEITADPHLPRHLQWAEDNFPDTIELEGKRYNVIYQSNAHTRLKIVVNLEEHYSILDHISTNNFPAPWRNQEIRLQLEVPGPASPYRPARGHSYSVKHLGLERIRQLAQQRLDSKR